MSEKRSVILIFCCSTLFFSLMVACAKGLSGYPVSEITLFRSLFAWLVVAIYVTARHEWKTLHTERVSEHFIRGLFGVVSMLCSFASYKALPMAEATALANAQPLFLAVFSVLLLKERARAHRWVTVMAGFGGVFIMLDPRMGSSLGGATLAISGAFFSALAMVMVRRLGRTESSFTVVFYFMLYATTASALLVVPWWRTPSAKDFLMLAATGVLGAFGQLLMVEGYRRAEASFVASFNYLQVVWAALIGFLIWHEVPRIAVWLGVCLILLSQLYLLRGERRAALV